MTAGSAPDRRTIPLLELITRESLDQDYRHAADRRAAAGSDAAETAASPGRRGRTGLTGLVILAFGLMATLAAVQTSRNAPIAQADKDQLIAQVEKARADLGKVQRQVASLQRRNTTTDKTYARLNDSFTRVSERSASLAEQAGFGAASGDGVVVQVTDAPNGSDSGEVRDSDLAALTNGLWAAGATAISVNGQRLTARSALRNSGSVIRVNGVSLSPPYTVTALGDDRTLLARFVQTASGQTFHDVTAAYGMPTSMRTASGLTVPAAPPAMLSLQYAQPLLEEH